MSVNYRYKKDVIKKIEDVALTLRAYAQRILEVAEEYREDENGAVMLVELIELIRNMNSNLEVGGVIRSAFKFESSKNDRSDGDE